MPEKKKPPRWQKGHRQVEVVLPADKTASGKEETVKLGISWQVRATKRRSARNWTKWEMDSARDYLARVANAVDRGEDFTSDHIWQTVRKPKHVPSLKEHFTPGDWIRSRYSGYGKVLAVRNSRMDVDFSGCTATLGPNPDLPGIEKVSSPEPEYFLPASERFSPGTWTLRRPFRPDSKKERLPPLGGSTKLRKSRHDVSCWRPSLRAL